MVEKIERNPAWNRPKKRLFVALGNKQNNSPRGPLEKAYGKVNKS